jgi:hypothetical protein
MFPFRPRLIEVLQLEELKFLVYKACNVAGLAFPNVTNYLEALLATLVTNMVFSMYTFIVYAIVSDERL